MFKNKIPPSLFFLFFFFFFSHTPGNFWRFFFFEKTISKNQLGGEIHDLINLFSVCQESKPTLPYPTLITCLIISVCPQLCLSIYPSTLPVVPTFSGQQLTPKKRNKKPKKGKRDEKEKEKERKGKKRKEKKGKKK